MALSLGLLTTALAITAPAPALASLEFCNRTADGYPLSLAIAYYNFGIIHTRFRRDGSTGLTITLNPRWTIRGWWEIPHNECIMVAADRDLNLKYHYYYAHSPETSYEDSGPYLLCGRKYGRFHIEHSLNRDGETVEILTLDRSGVRSVPVASATGLQAACTDLGYRLLPFNQIDVGGSENYTHDIF
ncbi:MAG TPA: DUF1036 domain-containing protein [Synechococcus sp. UBA8638]|uniref:DUF1036 domain-containing protein n=1 Tax=Candidatus Synechococcus spongiarum TaxID=431041 RepID=UPI00090728BF|nr:DUF1036 domain-containing protein [Synechococcus sp. UBA8638]